MLAGAVGLALVFVLGYLLEPDPRGHGTHVQMGLAPCTTRALFGLPCPFCGMTTSVSHLAHGDMAASIRTQPAGFVAGVGAALVGCLLVAGALIGRWPAVDPFRGLALRMLIALGVGGLLASWLYKMAQEGVF
jgi:hypothetical protein